MRVKIRTAPRASAIPAIPAIPKGGDAPRIAEIARIAVAPTPKPKTPFALLAEGMDTEYKRLRTQHPDAEKLLADAFAAAFAVACRVMDGGK